MIPMKRFALEKDGGEHCKNGECDDLLDDFQLQERERSAIAHEANAVGRHLTGIFRQGNEPRKEDDAVERPVRDDFHLLEFQVSIPCEGHENV